MHRTRGKQSKKNNQKKPFRKWVYAPQMRAQKQHRISTWEHFCEHTMETRTQKLPMLRQNLVMITAKNWQCLIALEYSKIEYSKIEF